MKILFIIPDYSGTGGAETVINTVCTEFEKREISYHIYIAAKRKTKNTEIRNLKWIKNLSHTRENYNLKIKKLNEYCHSVKINKIIEAKNINKIIVVDGNGISLAKRALERSGRKVPVFSWAHITTEKVKGNNLFKLADHNLTISKKISDQLEGMGIDKNKTTTIYNPVYPQKTTITFNQNNFLFIGRLRESHKKISTILHALRNLDGDWALHIIGDGPNADDYQKQALELGISNYVFFHGFIENPWEYIKENIGSVGSLLLSSRIEGFPMVLCEAMSYGIYCISSDCETGPNEIIKEGVNGQLFNVGDIQALSAYAQEIINNNVNIDHDKIKNSINHLYIDNYMNNLINTLEKVK